MPPRCSLSHGHRTVRTGRASTFSVRQDRTFRESRWQTPGASERRNCDLLLFAHNHISRSEGEAAIGQGLSRPGTNPQVYMRTFSRVMFVVHKAPKRRPALMERMNHGGYQWHCRQQ